MKVELEISNTQLEVLDKDLTTFLSTLDDNQKLILLSKYLENQFKGIYDFDNSWGQRTLTDFGRQLITDLRSKIADVYIENYYLNNEELKKELDKYVEDIKQSLPNIIKGAIAEYITNNLFSSSSEISHMIYNGIDRYIEEKANRNY